MWRRSFLASTIALIVGCGGTSTPDAGVDATPIEDAPSMDGETKDTGAEDTSSDSGLDGGVGCATAIAVGGGHACALKSDGSVWCWGKNNMGQLGDGTTTMRSMPVKVAVLGSTVVDVAAGGMHTCARKSDNTMWCWGFNSVSQVSGDGNTANRVVPAQVTAVGTVAQVATGEAYTCVRKLDSTLWCWGGDSVGQIGDGTTTNSVLAPSQVTALGSTVADVAAGTNHTCARLMNNTLWCWGSNDSGQIGDGTVSMGGCNCKPSPVQTMISSVAEVSVGVTHTCSRQSDSSVWCWGGNASGQIGDGTVMTRPAPTKVSAIANTGATINAGSGLSCVARKDGTASCWGYNGFGEIGDGTTTERHSPTKVLNLTSAARVRSFENFACALEGGFVWCWGDNTLGQLGIGMTGGKDFCSNMTQNCELAPVQVKGLCP